MSEIPTRRPRMSADAYAGFLRLLLTPLTQVPRPSEELDAYLEFVAEVERFDAAPEPDHTRAA